MPTLVERQLSNNKSTARSLSCNGYPLEPSRLLSLAGSLAGSQKLVTSSTATMADLPQWSRSNGRGQSGQLRGRSWKAVGLAKSLWLSAHRVERR